MNKTTISWPGLTHTWNPVVGCKRNCEFCYAKKLHEKRRSALLKGAKLPEAYRKPFDEIQFFPDRLEDGDLKKSGLKVFVGSMTDIYYWSNYQKEVVVDACYKSERNTFMFCSKNTSSYYAIPLPSNTMQGLTVTLKDRLKDLDEIILHAMRPRPFLSIEPIMGSLPRVDYSMFEHVIVGAMTGCGKDNVIPKQEWIESIRENCPAEKVHWKDNIKKYL